MAFTIVHHVMHMVVNVLNVGAMSLLLCMVQKLSLATAMTHEFQLDVAEQTGLIV